MVVTNGNQAREWAEAWNREGKLTDGRVQRAIADQVVCANLCRSHTWETEAGHWDAVNVLASYM